MARRLMGLHLYIRSKLEDLIFRGCFKIHYTTKIRFPPRLRGGLGRGSFYASLFRVSPYACLKHPQPAR